MKTVKTLCHFSFSGLLALALVACGSDSGSGGETTPFPLMSVTDEPAGTNCADGGIRVDTGGDTNGDGVLDPDEVVSTAYVCDGEGGSSGSTALVAVTDEPAGANCADGGQVLDYGIDDSGDGVLDASEVDGTVYVCDGGEGQTGLQSLVSVTAEPAGANCADGGQRIDYGIDDNGDGTLDAAEVDGTSYACNGAAGQAGLQSLVSVTAEPAGANCANGGQRIDYGIDDNGDGTLDAAEVDGTSYTCNGTDGTNGLQSLVVVTPEPAGANCSKGGQRIDYGIDDDSSGTLDPAEIDGTSYVCNAISACSTDADCGGALLSCDTVAGFCRDELTMWSLGTAAWPDEACNPTNSFGHCDTNDQAHADAWATAVCVNNGWGSGIWTGNKTGGCGNGVASGQPSVSMWCQGTIPCTETIENTCSTSDQTIIEFTCLQ